MTLKDNIQSNKGKAWYYFGIILAACLKEVIDTTTKYLPAETWWGEALLIISGYAIVGVSIIAPLIFGTDAQVERVKIERKGLGEALTVSDIKNEGLRVTNVIQAQLLTENKLNPYLYKYEKADSISVNSQEIEETEKPLLE